MEDLRVKVVADIKDLQQGLQQGEKDVKDFASTAENSLKKVNGTAGVLKDSFGKVITQAQQDFIKFKGTVDNSTKSLYNLNNELKALESAAFTEKSVSKVAQFNKEIAATKESINKLKLAGTDGFNELGEKIAKASGTGFDKLKDGASDAFGTVRTLANILPGIGIAGIIGFATEPIINYISTLITAKDAVKEFTASLTKDLAKDLDGVRAGALSSGLKLQEFVNIAKNGQLPLTQRNEALKEANAILGEHGQKLTLANVGTAAATKEVEQYTKAIIAQAVANKYADKISELQIGKTNAIREYLKAKSEEVATNQKIQQSYIGVSSAKESDGALEARNQSLAASAQEKTLKAANALNSYGTALKELGTDFSNATKESVGMFGVLGTKPKESNKHIKDTTDFIAELRKEVKGLQAEFANGFISKFEFDDKKIAAYAKAIKGLAGIDAPATVTAGLSSEIIETQIKHEIDKFNKKQKPETSIEAPVELKPVESKSDTNVKLFLDRIALKNKAQRLGIVVNVDLMFKYPELTGFNAELDKQLEARIALAEKTQALYQQTLENIAGGVGDALAGAFEGKDLGQELFKGLFKTLGAGVKAYGQQIIQTALTMQLLKNAFKVGNFASSIVIGIGLSALGGIIERGGGLKFARGGYVNGSGTGTSDSIQARLSNGEYVIKASTVNQFGKGFFDNINSGIVPTAPINTSSQSSSNIIIPSVTIKGQDLLLVFNRANASNLRNT